MSQLDILIPFGLPPAELSNDLLRELKTPALAQLIARASSDQLLSRREGFDAFARALPHEIWLANQFGLAGDPGAHNSPPIAAAAMSAMALTPPEGFWFILQPVHIHIAQDHLVLTDLRKLDLHEPESHALFEIARSLFDEYGKPLLYSNSTTWFVRADDWSHLSTATPDVACNRNIDIWMPKGEGERAWRKIQNEVQMHWFSHPINAERELRGLKPVNSLWLWGGSVADNTKMKMPYSAAYNLGGWAHGLSRLIDNSFKASNAADIIDTAPDRSLIMLDELNEPALSGEWAEWLQAFQKLETNWFAPLLEGLKAGKLTRISLIFSHNAHLATYTVSRQSLRKFWIKPSLARLCP